MADGGSEHTTFAIGVHPNHRVLIAVFIGSDAFGQRGAAGPHFQDLIKFIRVILPSGRETFHHWVIRLYRHDLKRPAALVANGTDPEHLTPFVRFRIAIAVNG